MNVVSEWFVVKWLHWLPNCMGERAVLFWTFIVTICAVLVGLGALVYAKRTVDEAKKQAQGNALAAQTQFLIMLRGVLGSYDDVHAHLRPGGGWDLSEDLPDDPVGRQRLEIYMGYFGLCERLLEKDLLNLEDFSALFKYRLFNIVGNGWVRKQKLGEHRRSWLEFISLCDRLGVKIEGVPKLTLEERSKLYRKGK